VEVDGTTHYANLKHGSSITVESRTVVRARSRWNRGLWWSLFHLRGNVGAWNLEARGKRWRFMTTNSSRSNRGGLACRVMSCALLIAATAVGASLNCGGNTTDVLFNCGMGGPTTSCHSSTEYCLALGHGDTEASGDLTYSCKPFPQGACSPASCDCVADAGLSCVTLQSCQVYNVTSTPYVVVTCN
jgi:hypothetical protein